MEIDSLCVTELVRKPVDTDNEYTSLLQPIEEVIERNWNNIIINDVYREADFTADYLANYALSLPLGVHHLANL